MKSFLQEKTLQNVTFSMHYIISFSLFFIFAVKKPLNQTFLICGRSSTLMTRNLLKIY